MNKDYFVRVMKQYAEDARVSTVMGRVARGYNDSELEKMGEFFAAQPWISPQQQIDYELAARGAQIHEQGCIVCHADGGRYSDPLTPRLAGQWRRYLEIVMFDYRDPERRMPHYLMTRVSKGMTNRDIRAIAHYYASQE
jgi:sulfide dehydrogenase cytochrome subunit